MLGDRPKLVESIHDNRRNAVFNVARLPHRGKAQMACNYCFPTGTIFQINSEF